MDGISKIFSKSSIHGLPYITYEGHGLFGRLAWLICVLVSFSLDAVIIWSNVNNWHSQPAVVTSVDYVPVEGQPWVPQVIACPSTLNGTAMMVGLLNHTHQKVLNKDLTAKLKNVMYKIWIMEEYHSAPFKHVQRPKKNDYDQMNNTQWEKCFEIKSSISESCDFVRVLAALLKNFGFTKAQEYIVGYVAESAGHHNTKDMLHYMSEKHNVSTSEIFDTSDSLTGDDGVFALYVTFFRVLNDGGTELLSPQSLSSYIARMPEFQLPSESKLGPYLAWLLNGYSLTPPFFGTPPYDPVQELYSLVSDIWLDSLKIFLGVDTNSQAVLLMNSFWHAGLDSDVFQPTQEKIENGYLCMSSNHELKSLDEICMGSSTARPECKEYCNLMNNIGLETKQKVQKVLKIGLDMSSPAIGIFQTCQLPTENLLSGVQCWKMVINDKGVCYTSKGGSLDNIVRREMNNIPLRILLDGSKHVAIRENDSKVYEITTEFGSRSQKRVFIHVVPYSQNAVEDSLGDDKDYSDSIELSHDPQMWKQKESTIESVKAHIDHVLNSTDAFKSMHPSQKKCYLPKGEKKLRNFERYSEADCTLECSWELAIKHCKCIPWYLGDMYPSEHPCETFGNRCFEKVIKTRYSKGSLANEQCQAECLPNCDRIHYIINKHVEKSNFNEDQSDFHQKYSSLKISAIPADVQAFSGNKTERLVTPWNMAILELRLSNSKLAQNIVRTATMTMTDLISNIGGTLGLFCGMSALSLAEILYWAGRGIFGIFSKRGDYGKKK